MDTIYASRVTIRLAGHLQRRAELPLGTTIEMGVHGPVVELFRLSPPRLLPLPVDYLVAAAAG